MLIIDTKQTYFDDDGKVLSGGRLRFFAFGTTTPVPVYADSDYITGLGSAVALTSAGWTSTGVHAQQSVTVHVDRYLGLDEYGAESYEEVKVYDYLTGSSTGGGSDSTFVDTIDDLRDVVPTDGLAVTVKGYYTAFDCFPRTYIWDADSSAVENLSTVIESSVEPTGRWLLGISGPHIDCRIFGIIGGLTTLNSQFALYFGYCNTYKKTAYIPTSTYYLTSGGSLSTGAPIKADKGVKIYSENGTYTLTLTNNRIDIVDTFAGTGLKMVLTGSNFDETIIPITAWDVTARGYESGTANFNLLLNNGASAYTWDSACTYNSIICGDGTHSVAVNSTVTANVIKGSGKISPVTSNIFTSALMSTSNFAGGAAEAMARCTGTATVDSNISLYDGFTTNAHIFVTGAGAFTTAGTTTMSAGLSSTKFNFISGTYGINFDAYDIDARWFHTSFVETIVKSFNASLSSTLDLRGVLTGGIVTRTGTIKNGLIYGVTAPSINLDRVTVQGQVTSTSIYATDSIFDYQGGNPVPSVTSMVAKNCQYKASSGAYISISGATLTDCAVQGNIITTGGNIKMRNVTCTGGMWVVPNGSKYVNSIDVDGLALTGALNFDATLCSVAGECFAYSTYIRGYVGTINAINNTTKKWAINGHSNVSIRTNKGSTEGSAKAVITKLTGTTNGGGYASCDKIFVLRTDDTLEAESIQVTDTAYANVYGGGTVRNSPRAINLSWYGQTGTSLWTGAKVNLTWKIYPEG